MEQKKKEKMKKKLRMRFSLQLNVMCCLNDSARGKKGVVTQYTKCTEREVTQYTSENNSVRGKKKVK